MDKDQRSEHRERYKSLPRLYEFNRRGEKSALEHVRSLKHELRTPVNHIIGYGALLLEMAEDAGNDSLVSQALEIQTIGGELNKLIERSLLSSDQVLPMADIGPIRGILEPLIHKIEASLVTGAEEIGNDSYLEDLNRIVSAARRLHSLLEKMQSQAAAEEIRRLGTA